MTINQTTDKRPAASEALAGLRVLDLTSVRSGPTAVRQLADWGADVVAIEAPPSVQKGEAMGGPRGDPDFQNLHRNKRAITLNLKHPEGVAIFKRMAETADVVVENFRPNVKTRLGIDYDSLKSINSRLVYASISGFGQKGPYADRPGFDHIAQGMGGLMSITGYPGQGPLRVGIAVADLCAGVFCAYGIVVALLERERSGKGQWVQTSLLQAQTFMLDFQAARWLMGGVVAGQEGNNHPTTAPTGVFKTKDGYVNIAAVGHKIWTRLCEALGQQQWLDDPRFKTNELRCNNREELQQSIDGVLITDTSARWVSCLNELGVPCGPIYSINQVFDDPQVRELNIVQKLDDNRGRSANYLSQPVTMTRTPSRIVQSTPAQSQHTTEILSEYGYSQHQMDRLRREAVI